ncbi:MAG: hypothetical protein ABIE68_00900 [bacterium]
MLCIISDQGYPKDGNVMARVELYLDNPFEGGIMILGKDSQEKEFKPKHEPGGSYALPSGKQFRVPVGNHSVLYFPFELNCSIGTQEIKKYEHIDDEFFRHFDLVLMDEFMERIELNDSEIERFFKKMVIWGRLELIGVLATHFWGEVYQERTPVVEEFLNRFRKQE